MATDQSEIKALHQFLGQQLENGLSTMTADEALEAFRAHQHDVGRLREHVAQSEGDEGKPLDDSALKERVRKRLAEHGITD